MNVEQLIAELSELDPKLEVYAHMDSIAATGCEVTGADSVERRTYPGYPKSHTPVMRKFAVIELSCYCGSD